jgi:hypothetical protein
MKGSVVWDITPCSPIKAYRHYGGTCHLHLQGRRVTALCSIFRLRTFQNLLVFKVNDSPVERTDQSPF